MTSQTAFRTALFDPACPPLEGLQNPDGAPATKRFDVYRNNVTVSLCDALATAFPVVRKLVGDNFFRALSRLYLRAHPPTSPVLMFYGDALPSFLESFAPAQQVPYLPDVARLELALRHSYHAADTKALDPAALAGISPDDLPRVTLSFAPAVHLIPSRYPLQSIWVANTSGDAVGTGAQPALVTRPDYDPQVDALTSAQAAVLTDLMSGASLGAALRYGGEGFDLGPLLSLLLARKALVSISV